MLSCVYLHTWYMFMMGFISMVMPDSLWRTSLSMFIMNRRLSRSRTSFFNLPIVTCNGDQIRTARENLNCCELRPLPSQKYNTPIETLLPSK